MSTPVIQIQPAAITPPIIKHGDTVYATKIELITPAAAGVNMSSNGTLTIPNGHNAAIPIRVTIAIPVNTKGRLHILTKNNHSGTAAITSMQGWGIVRTDNVASSASLRATLDSAIPDTVLVTNVSITACFVPDAGFEFVTANTQTPHIA